MRLLASTFFSGLSCVFLRTVGMTKKMMSNAIANRSAIPILILLVGSPGFASNTSVKKPVMSEKYSERNCDKYFSSTQHHNLPLLGADLARFESGKGLG